MAIKLKTEEGTEFSFDTVGEFMEFKNRMDEEEASKEAEGTFDEDSSSDEDTSSDEVVIPKKEPKFEVGDKVRVVENKSSGHVVGTIGGIVGVRYVEQGERWSYVVRPISDYQLEYSLSHKETDLELCDNEIEVGDKVRVVSSDDGSSTPYHYHDVGSVGTVVSKQQFGRIEVEVDGEEQYLLPHHYEKVESLGKDANGEDLYEGDYVTGSEDNRYSKTNDTVVMEVLGAGVSIIFREANIQVKIDGDGRTYNVDSSRFIKLADNLDEAEAKFYGIKVDEEEQEFKEGDEVRVVGNRAGHDLDEGDVKLIYDVDSDEPKYNLSYSSNGSWAHSEDIKLAEESSDEIEVGDLVYVRESLTDSYGDTAEEGTYAKVRGLGNIFIVTGVLVENKSQLDKLVLVNKKENISI